MFVECVSNSQKITTEFLLSDYCVVVGMIPNVMLICDFVKLGIYLSGEFEPHSF